MASTWDCTNEFGEVYAKELDYLRKRRKKLDSEIGTLTGENEGSSENRAVAPKVSHGTVGLALSGGGIRSATFSLGVLQALARLDFLKYVDYVSTVSGGGYLGSCVTSLLTANAVAGVRPAREVSKDSPQEASQGFPLGFTGADRERPEVQHLRNYSNYIAPQHGLFKLETWRLVAWYMGALVLNLICPLAATAFVLGLGTWFVAALWKYSPKDLLYWLGWDFPLSPAPWLPFRSQLIQFAQLPWLVWIVVLVGAISLFWLLVLFFCARKKSTRDWMVKYAAIAVALLVLPLFWFLVPPAYDRLVNLTLRAQPVSIEQVEKGFKLLELCSGPKGDECRQLKGHVSQLRDALELSGVRVGHGPTTLKQIRDGLGKAGVQLKAWEGKNDDEIGKLSFEGPLKEVIAGLQMTGFKFGYGAGGFSSWLSLILAILTAVIPAAYVGYLKRSFRVFGFTLAGLIIAVLLAHFLGWLYESYSNKWQCWVFAFLVITVVSGFLININRVSLLNFYRDRLADCYVIKQMPNASPPVVTNDGLRLAEILPQHHGPYHLINGALNLSGSNDLSLRGRMADHFLFSKFYCGSRRLGYSPTENYANGEMDLATAMAISAAAVSPQSGQQTRAGLAVLMSLLNLRLGQWLPNPSERRQHRLVFWNYFFVKELFSLADEDDWFVFVSDGGHFENTGVFSLLQRRCKTIISVDCGADPDRKFEDLSGLIRKARIDFGIQIEINLSKLHGDPKTKLAESAFAVGKILYPANSQDPGGEGCFLYIKPTLSSNNSESEDLLEYSRNHTTFPQESTADQFFDEAQFESYRELGYQITKKAFTGAGNWFKDLCEQAKDKSFKGKNPLEGYKGLDRS